MRAAKVGFIILSLLGAYVWGCTSRAGYRRNRVCIDCGWYSQAREYFGLSIPWKSRRTEMTDWYDRRIGKPHEHRWGWTGCGAMLNIWGRTMGYACGTPDPMARDHQLLASVLERLESMELDLPLYRALTDSRLRRREAAAEAVRNFFLTGWPEEDPEIAAWWEKTRRYLDSPFAWGGGFESF